MVPKCVVPVVDDCGGGVSCLYASVLGAVDAAMEMLDRDIRMLTGESMTGQMTLMKLKIAKKILEEMKEKGEPFDLARFQVSGLVDTLGQVLSAYISDLNHRKANLMAVVMQLKSLEVAAGRENSFSMPIESMSSGRNAALQESLQKELPKEIADMVNSFREKGHEVTLAVVKNGQIETMVTEKAIKPEQSSFSKTTAEGDNVNVPVPIGLMPVIPPKGSRSN